MNRDRGPTTGRGLAPGPRAGDNVRRVIVDCGVYTTEETCVHHFTATGGTPDAAGRARTEVTGR